MRYNHATGEQGGIMKLTSRHFATTLLAGIIGLISSTAAWAYAGQQYAQEARISPDKAETIAMNASRPCGFRLSKGFFHPLQAKTIAKQTCPPEHCQSHQYEVGKSPRR